MPALTRRRSPDGREERWQIFYGDCPIMRCAGMRIHVAEPLTQTTACDNPETCSIGLDGIFTFKLHILVSACSPRV